MCRFGLRTQRPCGHLCGQYEELGAGFGSSRVLQGESTFDNLIESILNFEGVESIFVGLQA